MEEEWIVDRSKLRGVWFEHPNWSSKKLAKEVGRSEAWTRKWLKRIRQAPLEDREVLNGRSRVPHKLPPSISEEVVDKILDILYGTRTYRFIKQEFIFHLANGFF